MTSTGPLHADEAAKAQIAALISYAEGSGQTLLAALLSQAADALDERIVTSGSNR